MEKGKYMHTLCSPPLQDSLGETVALLKPFLEFTLEFKVARMPPFPVDTTLFAC